MTVSLARWTSGLLSSAIVENPPWLGPIENEMVHLQTKVKTFLNWLKMILPNIAKTEMRFSYVVTLMYIYHQESLTFYLLNWFIISSMCLKQLIKREIFWIICTPDMWTSNICSFTIRITVTMMPCVLLLNWKDKTHTNINFFTHSAKPVSKQEWWMKGN